ncbi:hypothetical protein FH972_024647 [Carpinus fangiana]|uniref:NAD(P)-binding protein n=1 Tax=Carpinus fangiana TaxID=176857 RepID=A0A5N6L152_9ROSI|nr:hypothetical protein FH972_024647 [Carpinus fangiana]
MDAASSEALAYLDTIAYGAPYKTLKAPSKFWVRKQTHKGSNGKTVSIPDADLTGKWVVISGSNNGIGLEAASQFARWGANIVLACRNLPPNSRETPPESAKWHVTTEARKAGHKDTSVEWWELDMANLASVESFAQRWLDTGRPLDILCNNAGMGSSPGFNKVFKTKDGFEIIHQVNFLSHALLTLRLLPSLAAASEPRVVCTTSCFHFPGIFDIPNWNGENGKTGQGGVQFYMNNKLYFQTWLTELQYRLLQHDEYKHITINGVHPGYVNSGVWNLNGSPRPIQEGALKVLAWFLAINTQQGSLCITNAATSLDAGPDPKVQGVGKEGGKGGGRYFNRIWEDTPMPHTKDRDCRVRVWRKAAEELKLQEKGLLDVLGLKAT